MISVIFVLYVLTVAMLFGAGGMLRLIVAPAFLNRMNAGEAAKVFRHVFYRYCLICLLCAPLGIVFAGWLLADGAFDRLAGIVSLLLLAAVIAIAFWMRQTTAARMNKLWEQLMQSAASGGALAGEVDKEWIKLRKFVLSTAAILSLAAVVLLLLVVLAGKPWS